eukprot:1201590-Amphidinium_carterae.1
MAESQDLIAGVCPVAVPATINASWALEEAFSVQAHSSTGGTATTFDVVVVAVPRQLVKSFSDVPQQRSKGLPVVYFTPDCQSVHRQRRRRA